MNELLYVCALAVQRFLGNESCNTPQYPFDHMLRVRRFASKALLGEGGPSSVFVTGHASPVSLTELFKGKKVLLVGFVGAFTQICQNQFPQYKARAADFKAKGLDGVHAVSVNDPVVLKAFADSMGINDEVSFIADFNGDLVKHLGKSIDLSAKALGLRSTRFAALVDDGKITKEVVEEQPGMLSKTSAESVLADFFPQ